ncbi:MAG: phosphate ABC transporter substrate-binding protein PstS [Candidatus Tyrphobacter sp.]
MCEHLAAEASVSSKSGRAAACGAFALLLCACAHAPAPVRILETGSTLLYPLMNLWVQGYQATHPGVQITTQGTGSGTGISQAEAGVAQIGASDAYMPDDTMRRAPMLNIPLAISALLVIYNLPDLGAVHLDLSGPILAAIYSGSITQWDDPRIVAANPSLRGRLPHHAILVIYRSDGSGDTFVFTQYLSRTTPRWAASTGFGTSVSWAPSSALVGANGNPSVLQICSSARYAVAYIGISFADEVRASGLGYAALRNRAGAYVIATPKAIASAARALVWAMPADGRLSIVYAPGANSYPLVNYEYAIVAPAARNRRVRRVLQDFLRWTLEPGGGQSPKYLGRVGFVPLPPRVAMRSRAQVASIR